MGETEAVREFKEGLKALDAGFARRALKHLQRSVELDFKNPFYLSYLGLTLAISEKQYAKSEDLCFSALRMKRDHPELYLNLAEVYRRAGKLEDAVWTLRNGLSLTRHDNRIIAALERMGGRKRPVLSFLNRENPLNRKLGKLRHMLFSSRPQAAT